MKKRFKNITNSLQVIYDEAGNKRELVPKGTIMLEEAWGLKYYRVLEMLRTKESKKEE